MSELEDRINAVLGDPEQMEKLTRMAQSLMGGAQAGQQRGGGDEQSGMLGSLGIDPAMLGRIGRMMGQGAGDKPRERALLEAMKPFLSEKRRTKMDRAIKLAKMAQIARLAMTEMGGDSDDQSLSG